MEDIKELKDVIKDYKVMFVDDEEEIRKGTGMFLKKFFDDVTICSNGLEALEYFKKNKNIQIVITDIRMPKMDGMTMIKEIKKINPNIFTIFISANREAKFQDHLGDIYIDKPLSYNDIVMILNKIKEL
ncbi:MAG: response regulator [Campylobacterota bacterium]|nr:response regulator [Campylobacterota bacterium]